MLNAEIELVTQIAKAEAKAAFKAAPAPVVPDFEKRLDAIEKRLKKLETVASAPAYTEPESDEAKVVEPKVVKKK